MAILERTPLRKRLARDSEDAASQSRSRHDDESVSVAADKTFVFPPLEEMAASCTAERVNQVASSSIRESPIVQRNMLPSARSSRSMEAAAITPMTDSGKKIGNRQITPTQEIAQLKSPERRAQEEAFQAQIERALALGENPFMDRRRAAMRDDGDVSVVPSTTSTATKIRNTSQLGGGEKALHEVHAPPAESFVAMEASKLSKPVANPIPAGPSNHQAAGEAKPAPAPDSPPAVLFTPRRTTYTAVQTTQAVPVAQQEELHRLRTEVHGYRSRLREAQMQAEQSAIEAAQSRELMAEEKAERVRLQRQVDALDADLNRLEVQAKDAQRQLLLRCEQQKRQFDEDRRARDIDAVIARNEITYMSSQRREALAHVKLLKGKETQSGYEWQEEREQLHAELDGLRADKKQAMQRVKQLEGERVDMEDTNESLRSDLEREQKRRRDLMQREAAIRAELDEMQDCSARELSLRKELTALKAKHAQVVEALESEKGRKASQQTAHLASQKSQKSSEVPTSSSSSTAIVGKNARAQASTSARQTSRRKMQEEVESSMVEDESFQAETEAPQPKRAIRLSDAPPSGEARSPSKTKDSTLRTKRAQDAATQERSPTKRSPSPAATKRTTRKADKVIEKHVEPDSRSEPKEAPKTSIVPVTKRPAASVLARKATKQRSSATAPASSDVIEKKKVAAAAAPVAKADASYDETMRTPLLPSKRTRAIANAQSKKKEQEQQPSDNEENDQTQSKPLVKAKQQPRLSELAEATPMVRVDPEKKKRRKLLKAGSNVASDFLSLKGDANGDLAPTLNLPIELSPLKPGEQAGAGGGGASIRGRLGTGMASSSVANSLFARR